VTDRAREPPEQLRWAEEAAGDPRSAPPILTSPPISRRTDRRAGRRGSRIATPTRAPPPVEASTRRPFSRLGWTLVRPAASTCRTGPPVEPVRATAATSTAELDAEEEFDADDDLDPDEALRAPHSSRTCLRRISPAIAALTVGSVGSALSWCGDDEHTTPVGVLMRRWRGDRFVFALDTVILSAATYSTSKTEAAGWRSCSRCWAGFRR